MLSIVTCSVPYCGGRGPDVASSETHQYAKRSTMSISTTPVMYQVDMSFSSSSSSCLWSAAAVCRSSSSESMKNFLMLQSIGSCYIQDVYKEFSISRV